MISPFGLNSTLGRSYNGDLNDTRRAKKAFRNIGYFATPPYGLTEYPDEPLFKAIETFQSDNGLRRDGIMKPKGETATTLGKHLGSAPIQELNQTKEPENSKTGATQTALAPAIPAIVYEVAVFMGMTVTAAWAWWQTKSETEKKAVIAQMNSSGGNPEDEGLEHCEYLHYNVDIPVCNAIKRKRGAAAARRCFESAMSRYDACLRGIEIDYLPPLDKWNN